MSLPDIPVIDLGAAGFDRLAALESGRANILMEIGKRTYTRPLMKLADWLTEHWADEAVLPHKDEIRAIERQFGERGAWLFNLNYEWGCTSAAARNAQDDELLLRVLDWRFDGLGAQVVAARRQGPAGRWVNLTWPGFVGAIQGLAPGRFACAINQAPSKSYGLGHLTDWPMARLHVWRHRQLPPAMALRQAFDECADFAAALAFLRDTPLAMPVIFTLVGMRAGEFAIIERLRDRAVVHDTRHVTNHWLNPDFPGTSKALLSAERLTAIRATLAEDAGEHHRLAWLTPPVLNVRTRLAMVANPRTGRLVAQGWEESGPATTILDIAA